MVVHPTIHHLQVQLTEIVYNESSKYVKINWADNMGSIHLVVRIYKFIQRVSELSVSYTKFYKKDYKIGTIIIKEIRSRNPHIKISNRDTNHESMDNNVHRMTAYIEYAAANDNLYGEYDIRYDIDSNKGE